MNKEKGRVPKLRFPGFTEDWEQCKLDDIAKIKTGGGTPKTAKPEYWSGNIPWIQSSDLVEGDITHVNINKFINNNALKNSAAKLISRDSIALVTRVGVGKVAVINQDFTTSQDFLSLSDFDRSDIKFLAYQLYRLMQENAKVLQGTSIKGITKTELIEQSISIPNSGQEQHLISNVLSKIDSIITLHQRKLEHLNLKKKALLQKLFPKDGERYPELRFPGFTDAWEQRKLLTVLNKIVDYRGRTPKKLGLDWSLNGHLALSALNVKMGYVDKTVDAHYGDDHLYSVWMKDNDLYEGQVLFTTEAPMGNVAQVPDNNKYILSQRTIAFVPDRSVISDNFLAVVLSASKCQKSLINRASGGTAKGVSQKTLSEIFLDIPQSLSEQDKVSELIKKLSKIITLHQRKLEHLQLQKKALLQQMFV